MPKRLLPASILPGLLEIALKSRLNVQALFADAGIDPDAVGRADRFIPQEQLDLLLTRAFNEAQDPFFGLRVGMENHYASLDVLGNLLATADTLGDALALLPEYKDLIVPYVSFSLTRREDTVTLVCESDPAMSFTRQRPHHEVMVATVVAIGRSLVGGELGLRSVTFAHEAPKDLSLYEQFFAVPMHFGAGHDEVAIDAASLAEPLPTAFPRYHQRLRRLAGDQLRRISQAQGVVGQVLDLIQSRLGREDFSMEAVAGRLNITPRTLQRRLREEGCTFISLRDQVREQRACELLGGDMEMQEIADALGFSDTANFYHAFKRWQNCSPGEFRRRLGGSLSP